MATRRMNEMWRRTALTLVLCVLISHSCLGQNGTAPTELFDPAPATQAPGGGTDSADTAAPQYNVATETDTTTQQQATSQAIPSGGNAFTVVSKEEIFKIFENSGSNSVFAGPTKSNIELSTQSSKTVEEVNDLAVERKDPNVQQDHSAEDGQQSPAVFVSLLVTGLLLAAGLIGGYVCKNRRSNAKGMKLAEESVMADEENQGNTLVSVAPLNPPEPQEKPSLNGESPEAVKTQNPPAATNGHSTTKTADTEL